jgi:hypothetical protein
MKKQTQDEDTNNLKEESKVMDTNKAEAEKVDAEKASAEKVDAEKTSEEKVESAEPSLKSRLLSVDHWLRFAFMALFILILSVVSYLIVALIVLQFFWALFAGEGNNKLKSFGDSASLFIFQVLQFLTYNSNEKPFPFADWPESKNVDQDK